MNYPYGVTCQKCQTPIKSFCELSGWALIEYILFCHVLWWIFYYLLLIVTRQSAEWCCRFVTLIHGCLVSYAAITDIVSRETHMTFGSHSLSEAQKTYLSYMLSYFLFDFGWMHFFGNEKWIIYFHHVTSIIIIVNVLFQSYGGDGVSYGVAGLELSNPYLQLRWFLRTHGQLNKPIHVFTELWFVLIFFLIRMVGGTVLLYRGLLSSHMDYGMKLSFIAIYGISVVLQWQICGFIRKKYLSPESRRNNLFRNRDSFSIYLRTSRDEEPDGEKNPLGAPPEEAPVTVLPTDTEDTVNVTEEPSTEVQPKPVEPTQGEPEALNSPKEEHPQTQSPESDQAEASDTQSPSEERQGRKSKKIHPWILKIKR